MDLLDFDVFTHVVQCTSNKDSKTPYTTDNDHLVYCYDDADSQIKPHFPGKAK
jgi:Zn-dependent M28 family amino/carboxypeptidase